MSDLEGRVAVVTGSASGIGLAMAHRFTRAGMRLAERVRDELGLVRIACLDAGVSGGGGLDGD